MWQVTFPQPWRRHGGTGSSSRHEDAGARQLAAVLAEAGIEINGSAPWDMQVRDERLYRRLFTDGTLGLGESYMDGWWDADAVDELFCKARIGGIETRFRGWNAIWLSLASQLSNLQNPLQARRVAEEHYDLGNDLYEAMLDSRMQYSCGYWRDAANLEEAQLHKLDLIARKLQLGPGMRVLELGGGFGGFARFAAQSYGCEVVSYNISKQQVGYAREKGQGLAVRMEEKDYRAAVAEQQPFDRVVSIGMCEHVGHKNLGTFLEVARHNLRPKGLFLLHTIGANQSATYSDPWIHKYIFPNGVIPSVSQLGQAMEGLWVVEDWHNFGPDYDRTLLAWWRNFEAAWPRLRPRYGDRFFRMWKYYLLACAGSFRARSLQLWQLVLSRGDISSYRSVR